MKYLLMMQIDPEVLAGLTEEQGERIQQGHTAFMAATKASGEFIGTQALADPSQSRVVRSRGGVPEVVDGPFVEAKEFLGGYYLIEVDSPERAVELACSIPDASIDGLAIEIRPVMFCAGFDS